MNDAVLRAFELMTGKNVIRTDLAGLMGAYGCALLARECWDGKSRSTLSPLEKIRDFKVKTRFYRCGICENNCPITMIIFPDRRRFISGNRCERGTGKPKKERAFISICWKKKWKNCSHAQELPAKKQRVVKLASPAF